MTNVKTMRTREEIGRYSRTSSGKSWMVSLVVKLSFMFALIFLAVNARIIYNQKSEQINREIARTKSKIHQLNREIANLKVRREQLSSWPYISSRINQFKLGLRPADSKQIRKIVLVDPDGHPRAMHSAPALYRETRTAGTN